MFCYKIIIQTLIVIVAKQLKHRKYFKKKVSENKMQSVQLSLNAFQKSTTHRPLKVYFKKHLDVWRKTQYQRHHDNFVVNKSGTDEGQQ